MKHYLLLSILALTFMVSCQNEELIEAPLQVGDKMEVSATLVDESQTRTQHSSDFKKVLWSENDAISVFTIGEESCHDRYYLTKGVGTTSAKFQWDKTYNGTIIGGVEGEDSKEDVFYVGVYPFMEGTSVKVSIDSYEINTMIPTNQKYAENSFGQEAFVMVGVDLINSKPNIAFKNVGTILIFPLNGNATIQSVTLKSETCKIAGSAVVTVSAENNFIPSTDISNGENEITLSCGEGVQLKGEEYTNFCFVLAPGTYDDLVVKFTDTYGNYFEQKIENPKSKEMKRSMSYNMPKMTFYPQGTEEVDLWVKAKAGASMSAERIIPSVKDVDVEGWVKNLKDQANTKALIEEAITYITLKNYKAAYEVLGGIPGFVKDVKRFEANGSFIQKVDYTGASYLVSMLEGIESINNIQSLLDYLNEFEKVYEASGLKNKLDENLGSIADNFDAYIDAFVESSVNQKPDENLSEEEALAAYKANIKKQLENSVEGWDTALAAIKKIQEGVKNPLPLGKVWLTEPNPSFMKDEVASLEAYLVSANALLGELEGLVTKEVVEERVKAIAPIKIEVQSLGISREINPETWLTGADAAYADKLKEQIASNEKLIAAAKVAFRTSIQEISSKSLVESLETAVNEPGSTTGKVLNYLFAQESFMESVKTSLREIVTNIEEESKDKVDAGNVDKKQQAINTAIQNTLINARVDAVDKILLEFNATNEANLNNGPWATFKKILNWQKCVEVFAELKILDVYDALVELSEVVDEMITYDRGSILYDIEEFADYQENVDWWVLKFNEEL